MWTVASRGGGGCKTHTQHALVRLTCAQRGGAGSVWLWVGSRWCCGSCGHGFVHAVMRGAAACIRGKAQRECAVRVWCGMGWRDDASALTVWSFLRWGIVARLLCVVYDAVHDCSHETLDTWSTAGFRFVESKHQQVPSTSEGSNPTQCSWQYAGSSGTEFRAEWGAKRPVSDCKIPLGCAQNVRKMQGAPQKGAPNQARQPSKEGLLGHCFGGGAVLLSSNGLDITLTVRKGQFHLSVGTAPKRLKTH